VSGTGTRFYPFLHIADPQSFEILSDMQPTGQSGCVINSVADPDPGFGKILIRDEQPGSYVFQRV
jgi:hypothetical protein